MNFNKYIVAASLVTLGLVGCASHTTAPVAVAPPPPAPVVAVAPAPAAPITPAAPVAPVDPLLASGDHFSFKVPDATWEIASADELPDESVLAVAQNASTQTRVMLLGEATSLSTQDFLKNVLGGLAKNGVKVLSKPTNVTLNGNQFAYVETQMGKIHVYMWVTAKDGQSFGLMCGSASNAPSTKATCQSIAATLTLK